MIRRDCQYIPGPIGVLSVFVVLVSGVAFMAVHYDGGACMQRAEGRCSFVGDGIATWRTWGFIYFYLVIIF